MLDTVTEYIIIIASVLTITLIKLLITPQQQPIFNIYRTPSSFYWLKVAFMYVILSLRKYKRSRQPAEYSDEELERPHKLSYHEKAIDAVYFNGGNAQGDYLALGTARRKNNLIDGFLFLKVSASNLGVLETPKIPSTALYKTEDNDEYHAEGLKVTLITPMRKWNISYTGKMKKTDNPTETHDVRLNLDWISDLPHFNFEDMDPLAMAKDTALEPWSREFFNILKAEHQTHYEQFGSLIGKAVIDNKEYPVNISACRDHSFGVKRDWSIFHRYGLHYFTTEDGDRFTLCKISAPIMFSDLSLGFVYLAKEKKIYPIQHCDLELYQHGEGGNPPTDYAFSITAGNKQYIIQINVEHSPFFFISKEWESKVIERFCSAEINGKKGWGIAEWQYQNILGKRALEQKTKV